MADRCLYEVPARDGEAWLCSLSEVHDGDHYLVRAAGGRVTPIPPDSEREARRAQYAQRERQRAAAALNAWFRVALMIKLSVWDIVNGARVVEEIARFVLDAAGDDLWDAHDAVMKLQQKSHSARYIDPEGGSNNVHERPSHNADSARYIDPEGGSNNVHERPSHNADSGPYPFDPTGALADMCSQLPGCRPSTDGEHSASCEVSFYRARAGATARDSGRP